jgi:hypothetical protein
VLSKVEIRFLIIPFEKPFHSHDCITILYIQCGVVHFSTLPRHPLLGPSGLRSNPEVQHPYGLGGVLLVLENGSDTFTLLHDSTQSFVHAGSVMCDYWVRICVNRR